MKCTWRRTWFLIPGLALGCTRFVIGIEDSQDGEAGGDSVATVQGDRIGSTGDIDRTSDDDEPIPATCASAEGCYAALAGNEVVRSRDGGVTWSSEFVDNNEALTHMVAGASGRLVAVGHRALQPTITRIMYSDDGGQSWRLPSLPAGSVDRLFRVAEFAGTWFGVGGGQSDCVSSVYRSVDDGLSWTKQGFTGMNCLDNVAGTRTAWLVGQINPSCSTDDGETWAPAISPAIGANIDVGSDGHRFVAVGTNQTIAYSDDCLDWTQVMGPNGFVGFRHVVFIGDRNGPTPDPTGRWLAIGSELPVHVSDDRGETWTPVGVPLAEVDAAACYADTCVIIADSQTTFDILVYRSFDRGTSWPEILSFPDGTADAFPGGTARALTASTH